MPMRIGVCVKRVPMVGGRIVLTEDGRDVDTRMSGFTVSPHEECAVEEAVRLVERFGGSVTVLTLGPAVAADQLRDMLALGANRAVLLETDGREWGPIATAAAIAEAFRDLGSEAEGEFDLLLFGNEAADTGDYQVGVRVAHALGLPCVTGIKNLEIAEAGPAADAEAAASRSAGAVDAAPAAAGRSAGAVDAAPAAAGRSAGAMDAAPAAADQSGAGRCARARREYRGAEELFELLLPAVMTVKEGINLPRYPSLPGRLRARRAVIEELRPAFREEGLRTLRLRVPEGERRRAEILGTGPEAVPALVALLGELGVLP
jgi:electron transfer flavoprotein beta subunit